MRSADMQRTGIDAPKIRALGRLVIIAIAVAVLGPGCLSRSGSVVRPPQYSWAKSHTYSRSIVGRRKREKQSRWSTGEDAAEGVRSTAVGFTLKEGDHVIIHLGGIPEEQQIEDVVDEEGCITLPYLGRVKAVGLTTAQLEKKIRQEYINQKIYNDLAVNVVQPTRSFFVRGEVRQPGRFPLVGELTLSRAVAQAGGYTEFANPGKIRIIRGQKTFYVNARVIEKHPERDIPIVPGDVIVVPRSIF